MIEPGLEYYRATSDGEGQAMIRKAQGDIARG